MPYETTSNALAKRNNDTALMPPPPPPKRQKRPPKVLDEDDYVQGISHIIARDYYPGLLETQYQQEYMDALKANDRELIKESGKRLTQVMTPGPDGRRMRGRRGVSMTPSVMGTPVPETPRSGWGGETPGSVRSMRTDATGEEEEKREKPDTNMSLSAFQTKYTSEDNESFNALLDKQNAKRTEKYAFLYNGNKILAPRQIAHRAQEQKLLEQSKPRVDSEKQVAVRDIISDKDRPAMPNIKKSEPRNTLMFSPEGVEDTYETLAQKAEAASYAPPKKVMHENTRFKIAFEGPERPPSPTGSTISGFTDAINGRIMTTASEAAYDGSLTPRVNGYSFVDAEPEPGEGTYLPSLDEEEPDTNLLKRFGPVDAEPNPFTISDVSKRESLHHRLVDKNAKSKRIPPLGGRMAELRGGATPKFVSSPVQKGNLTPAAQKLFHKVGGSTPRRDAYGGAFGGSGGGGSAGGPSKEKNLRSVLTPTPKR